MSADSEQELKLVDPAPGVECSILNKSDRSDELKKEAAKDGIAPRKQVHVDDRIHYPTDCLYTSTEGATH